MNKKYLFHILAFLGLFLISNHKILSQNVSYDVELIAPGSYTYSDLEGDSVVPQYDLNGLHIIGSLVGEKFMFFKDPFVIGGISTVSMGEGGFMRIDNDSSLVIIDALFTYLDTINTETKQSYKIEGAPGDRIIKMQWKNMSLRSGAAANYANFQIWYYQSTGVIELRYGKSALNESGFTSISGPNVGIFYSPDDFSKCYEKIWIKRAPEAPVIDSNTNFVFGGMFGVPPEGTVYRFTPRFKFASQESLKIKSKITCVTIPSENSLEVYTSDVAYTYQILEYSGRMLQSGKMEKGKVRISMDDAYRKILVLKSKDGIVISSHLLIW